MCDKMVWLALLTEHRASGAWTSPLLPPGVPSVGIPISDRVGIVFSMFLLVFLLASVNKTRKFEKDPKNNIGPNTMLIIKSLHISYR